MRHLVRPFIFALTVAPVLLADTAFAQGTGSTETLGHLDISTSDRQGTIELDGKTVGSAGSYQGDIPPGNHHVKITRDGYEPYEKHFTIAAGQVLSEAVSLRLSGSSQGEGSEQGNSRPFNGTYGGLGLGALFMPSGQGNTLESNCAGLGAVCDTSAPLGGSFFAYGGYSWNPIGIELFVLGSYDASSPRANFDGVVPPGGSQTLSGPARVEDFTIRRLGGVGAVRVRYTVDGPSVRVHGALGAGFAYRTMFLVREAQAADGAVSKFVPDSVDYLSPYFNVDLGVHFRLSGFLGLSVGGMMSFEKTGDMSKTGTEKNLFLVNPAGGPSYPHPTEPYDLARGVQFFIGPYVGLEFGP